MTKLSVNVNKLALIRNSREKNHPDVVKIAKDLLAFGAHGITIHPRPDGRHIRKTDIEPLSELVQEQLKDSKAKIEFNIEGYPSDDFLEMLLKVRPHQATLVPDPPEALTSNAGWDFVRHESLLKEVCQKLKASGIRVSLFLDPSVMTDSQWKSLGAVNCDRVELYTEAYADQFAGPQEKATLATYKVAAQKAVGLGLGVNAGHDLNLKNLGTLIHQGPEIEEVSIGHALVCEALYLGFQKTIESYLEVLKNPHAH